MEAIDPGLDISARPRPTRASSGVRSAPGSRNWWDTSADTDRATDQPSGAPAVAATARKAKGWYGDSSIDCIFCPTSSAGLHGLICPAHGELWVHLPPCGERQGGSLSDWHQDIQAWPHTDFSPVTIGVYLEKCGPEQGPLLAVRKSARDDDGCRELVGGVRGASVGILGADTGRPSCGWQARPLRSAAASPQARPRG